MVLGAGDLGIALSIAVARRAGTVWHGHQCHAIDGADHLAAQLGGIVGGQAAGEGRAVVQEVHGRLALADLAAGVAGIGEAVADHDQAGGPGGGSR